MEAFVYCWTDHKTQKLYIGYHKGTLDDGYVCSSKLMNEQYQIRPEDFTRQIIAEGNMNDIRSLEEKLLIAVDARNNPEYYNQHNGNGEFYNKGHSESTKQKLALAGKSRIHSEETRRKMSVSHTGKKRKTTSYEIRQKISNSRKGQSPSVSTRQKLSAIGKTRTFSAETKKRISESQKKRWYHRKGIKPESAI
jgi:lipocalin